MAIIYVKGLMEEFILLLSRAWEAYKAPVPEPRPSLIHFSI
jgi:hypothetical protein